MHHQFAEVNFDTSYENQLSYFQNGYFFKILWWSHQPHNKGICRWKNKIISECFTINNHGFSFVSFSTEQTLSENLGATPVAPISPAVTFLKGDWQIFKAGRHTTTSLSCHTAMLYSVETMVLPLVLVLPLWQRPSLWICKWMKIRNTPSEIIWIHLCNTKL